MGRYSPVRPVGEYKPFHIATAINTAIPIGDIVSTTGGSIAAGSNIVVTPGNMTGIAEGRRLQCSGGVGATELVTIKALNQTTGTFTADFQFAHSGSYLLRSLWGTNLGPLIINAIGSGMTLTLYDGNPAAGGTAIAVISDFTRQMNFQCACDAGLWLTYSGTTPGDLTLQYENQTP